MRRRIAAGLRVFVELVRFEHTVFALPFAYVGMLLGAERWPPPRLWGWVTVTMVAARTAGMAWNRAVDRREDMRNPRTRGRPLPSGRVTVGRVWALALVSVGATLLASAQVHPLCLWLAPGPVALMALYPLMKRVTWASHLVLGAALGCAPAFGWIAVTGRLGWEPIGLATVVTCWVAGFDILYACQDEAFDRAAGLYSIPAVFGAGRALRVARGLHAVTVLGFAWIGWQWALGPAFWIGWLVVGGLLAAEHRLIMPTDLSRLNQAFFTQNAWVSVVLFLSVVAARATGRTP